MGDREGEKKTQEEQGIKRKEDCKGDEKAVLKLSQRLSNFLMQEITRILILSSLKLVTLQHVIYPAFLSP